MSRLSQVVWCLTIAPMLGIGAAQAAVINFDSAEHGQRIDNEFLTSHGVLIQATNFQGGPNLAITFDTTRLNTADPDLQDPWDRGNIPSSTLLRDVLIIAENSNDSNGNGFIDSPDDQAETATRGSGELRFTFTTLQRSFGFDMVDVEDEWGLDSWFVSFRLAGVELSRVEFDEFLDSSSPFFTRGIVFGDNSANRVDPITAEEMNIAGFNEVVINMRASGGIDNVSFEAAAAIPEPSTAVIGAGLLLPLLARRRRNVTH